MYSNCSGKLANKLLFLMFFMFFLSVNTSPSAPLTDPDNKHNMSNLSDNTIKAQPLANDGTDQICIFCHTPHSATPDSPLWSRPDPATSTFPIYGNPLVIGGGLGADPSGQTTRSQYNTDAVYPNGASRMCLSCHDGVTAIGLLSDGTTINMLGGNTLNDMGSSMAIDLSTSHPVSFVYDGAVLADLLAYYGPGSYILPDTADAVDTPLDGKSRMQCTTCHDPHNDTSLDGGGLPPFWRQSSVVFTDEYDDVCAACHTEPEFTPAGPSGDHQLP